MSSWRDDLQRVTLPDGRRLIGGSFRGVTFFVRSSDRTGGRRGITHEFPKRDNPFVEDNGRRARVFSVEAYVIGDDYVQQRDALMTACEDVENAGTLVHPYHGIRRCICTQMNVRESIDDGRLATFALTFDESPVEGIAPSDEPDLPEQVETATTLALEATTDELLTVYDVDGQPGFALESLSAELSAVAAELEAQLEGVVSATQELARMKQEIQIITAQATSLIRTPAQMLTDLTVVIQALVETAADAPKALVDALVDTYALPVQALALPLSATRIQEAVNQAALADALRRVLLAEAARLLATVTFESIDDALDARDSVVDLIDEQLLVATDESFPELQSLRASIILAVPGDDQLARIITFDQRSTVASLLLAYRLYGSVDLESDVIARNNVTHPGFISGTLQVLTDV